MEYLTGALHQLSVLDGNRPHLRTPEMRRKIDAESLATELLPEIAPLKAKFLADGGEIRDEYYETSRGLKVFTRTYIPGDSVEKRGGVMACHGYTAHLRFQQMRTMLEYANRGFVVTGMEYEGHGWSDGICGLVQDADKMLDDVDEFFQRQQAMFADLEWMVHGESLGGMVALDMCVRAQADPRRKKLKGAVFVAPMCKIAEKVKPPQAAQDALIFISRYVPELSLTPSSINTKLMFKQPHIVEAFDRDPLRYMGRPRLATAREFFHKTVELEHRIPEIETPFFVIHGEDDVVTTSDASKELYDLSTKVAEEDKELVIVKGAWHGLMWGEEEKEENWKRQMSWVESRF